MVVVNRKRKTRLAGLAVAAAALALAGCGDGPGSPGPGSSGQVPTSAAQTIVFATAGVGSEGAATAAAIAGFEKLHPNIKVSVLALSTDSTTAQQQEEHYFLAGSSTPDVVYTDVTWPSTFAKSGWIADLSPYHPDTSAFFPAQMATGEYNGSVYAIPWFINAEGLFYRTDLVKTPRPRLGSA